VGSRSTVAGPRLASIWPTPDWTCRWRCSIRGRAGQSELVSLIRESKDLLEATKFLSGAGHASNEPQGLLVGAASEHVQTATSATFAIADVYGLKEGLGPRYWAGASWLGSPAIFDRVRRFVGGGSQEVPLWDDGPPPTVLRKPISEYPQMATTIGAGNPILVYGDFRQAFVIVDRIGMNVELIPMLFGENQRPTGQRGLYAYWRNSSLVVNPNALRCLVVKS
jgi:HK97 family phage major capsid protein